MSTASAGKGFRSLLLVPWVRVLACSVAVFLLCYIYGATHFFRDPGSIFFDPSYAYDRFYSRAREVDAMRYMDAVMTGQAEVPRPDAHAQPSICASFLTVARPVQHQYIYNSVGSLLAGLTPRERSDIHLKLFFADLDPTRHPSHNEPWTKSLLDESYTYSDAVSEDTLQAIRQYAEQDKLQEKGVLDYAAALQHCLNTTDAPFIAVFEDDILLAEGWLARTLVALRKADALVRKSPHPERDWLDLRLFNQERSTGWFSRRIGGNAEFIIAALIDMPLILILVMLRRNIHRVTPSRSAASTFYHYTGWAPIAILTLVTVPSFIILFFQSGKASLLPPSPGLKIENFGCCSQAIIFNRRQVPAMINFLKSQNGAAPYDMLTAYHSRRAPLHRLALYPMQAQHVGLISASGTTAEDASKVWSMAFESLNSHWLARSHEAAVKALYN